MIQIKKMRADHVVDFAAEELKKYLRMMMPECGEIDILYAPEATDGFRLGLLSGLELEARDLRQMANALSAPQLEQLKAAYARQAQRNYPLQTQLQYTQRQAEEHQRDTAFMI